MAGFEGGRWCLGPVLRVAEPVTRVSEQGDHLKFEQIFWGCFYFYSRYVLICIYI